MSEFCPHCGIADPPAHHACRGPEFASTLAPQQTPVPGKQPVIREGLPPAASSPGASVPGIQAALQHADARSGLTTPSAGPGEALAPGTMVGEYKVAQKLGEGGMGAVFAAVHPRIGKRVAIKVLNRALIADPQVVSRFENEARAVNEIGHRHIVDIFSFGLLPDGSPYFVMEWLEGESLEGFLERKKVISLAEGIPIVKQICRALTAAHQKQIVHRDLKPDNIFIAREADGAPFVKLLDFGIAKFHTTDEQGEMKMTRTGTLMGTPYFMSPEQATGRGVDHRTDIYAMGVLLFRMFTGRYPFVGESYIEILTQHLSVLPPRPSEVAPKRIGFELEMAILKCLEKEPDKRFPNVEELYAALEACPGVAGPGRGLADTGPTVLPPKLRPRRWGPIVAIAAVLALALGIGGFVMFGNRGGTGDSRAQPPAQPGGPEARPAADVTPHLRMPPPRGFKRGDVFEPTSPR